jgi:hypothetical protein
MRRREFLGILGCAVTWPVELQAQYTERVRVVGILNVLGPDDLEAKPGPLFSNKLFRS